MNACLFLRALLLESKRVIRGIKTWGNDRCLPNRKRRLEVLPVLRKAARRPCVEPVSKLPKKERTLNGNDESDLIEGNFAPTTSGNAAEPIVID